ncbi:MAG: AAA family ATPase [Proteobacteria bacterium]|nr:AAA family ATPase [Pseudomonadota bacterium]
MSFLFIGSTGDRAGHTLFTWALAKRLLEKGLRLGLFKPFGTDPILVQGRWTDHDASLFKEALNLQEPLERICPYLASDETWRQKGNDEVWRELKSLSAELSEGKDLLIVMGSRHIFFDDTACPVPDVSLVAELDADFVLIHRYQKVSSSIYSILSVSSLLKERVKGIILNRVPPEHMSGVRDQLVHGLGQRGIPMTAALPEDPILASRSLHEAVEALDGRVLCGGEGLHKPIGGVTVGSADLTGDLALFKRAYNKIVLLEPTGIEGETTQAQRPITGILLTGGRNPAPQLLHAAQKANVPLILVRDDTFTALEKWEQSASRLSPGDENKVRRVTALLDSQGALDRFLESLSRGYLPRS